jgi:hypothetical protein
MDKEDRRASSRMQVMQASAGHIDERLFVFRWRGLLHGKKSFRSLAFNWMHGAAQRSMNFAG